MGGTRGLVGFFPVGARGRHGREGRARPGQGGGGVEFLGSLVPRFPSGLTGTYQSKEWGSRWDDTAAYIHISYLLLSQYLLWFTLHQTERVSYLVSMLFV